MNNALVLVSIGMATSFLAATRLEAQGSGYGDFQGQYAGIGTKYTAAGIVEADKVRLEITGAGKVFGVIEVDPSKPFLQIEGRINSSGFGYIKQGALDPTTSKFIQDPEAEKIPVLVKRNKRMTGDSLTKPEMFSRFVSILFQSLFSLQEIDRQLKTAVAGRTGRTEQSPSFDFKLGARRIPVGCESPGSDRGQEPGRRSADRRGRSSRLCSKMPERFEVCCGHGGSLPCSGGWSEDTATE